MEIRVSGHQMDTGSALQEHATERLDAITEKFFSRALSSAVTFGKAPAGAFACDIVLHVNQGLILKSHGQAQDAHQAFEQAAEKVEKQLRRYKRRLKDRHEQADHAVREEEAAYTVFAAEEPDEEVVSDEDLANAINVPGVGRTGTSARSARWPWPISRRPGPRIGLFSPVLYGGML